MRYLKYFYGIIRHKHYVLIGCVKMKVGILQAIFHDISKFHPIEFFPYARTFYNSDGTKKDLRRKDGGYDPNNTKEVSEFSYAWIHHQKNKHHWQAWISIGDFGNLKPVKIPEKYIREMIADWIGAGLSYSGENNPVLWYNKNKETMILHEESRNRIEELLRENFEVQ